jgi:hypothetical protein
MYPILIIGLIFVISAIRYAAAPERRHLALLGGLGLSTLLCGLGGTTMGLIASLGALDRVAADQRWIVLLGLGESLNNLALALVLLLLGSLIASAGAYRLSRGGPGGQLPTV